MNEQKRMKLIDEAIDAFGFKVNIEMASFFRGKKGDLYHSVRCDEGVQTRLLCTNEEYLARIAERQNKPSWDDAPEWANWIAQDYNGEWYFFEDKPPIKCDVAFANSVDDMCLFASKGEVIGRWQDTLEEDPTKASEPFTPEVGGTYFLGNKPGYDLSYGHDIIGESVQLKAIWKTSNGYNVGAVEHESAGYVFMLDMLEPQKSECEEFVGDWKRSVYLNAIKFEKSIESISMKQSTGEDIAASVLEYVYECMRDGIMPNPQPTISREEFIERAMEITNRMIDADMSDSALTYGAVYDELVNPV